MCVVPSEGIHTYANRHVCVQYAQYVGLLCAIFRFVQTSTYTYVAHYM